MTLAGLSSHDQVEALGLKVGDLIEAADPHEDGVDVIRMRLLAVAGISKVVLWDRWRQPFDHSGYLYMGHREGVNLACHNWRKISSDPTLDPCAPLRAELREAYEIIHGLIESLKPILSGYEGTEIDQWLTRNAGFGPGKEGHSV